MSTNTLLQIQTGLIFLQLVNAEIATIPGMPRLVPVLLVGLIGAGQFFVQHVGNQTLPPSK